MTLFLNSAPIRTIGSIEQNQKYAKFSSSLSNALFEQMSGPHSLQFFAALAGGYTGQSLEVNNGDGTFGQIGNCGNPFQQDLGLTRKQSDGHPPKRARAPIRKTVGQRRSEKVRFSVDIDLFLERMAMVRIVYDLPNSVMEFARKYLESFHNLRLSRGEEAAVNRYKEYATYYKGITLGGQPPIPSFGKIRKGRLTVLAPLDKISYQNGRLGLEFAQTVSLFYLAQTTHQCKEDFSTIEGPSPNVQQELLDEFDAYIKTDPLRVKRKSRLLPSRKVRITGAQGVYGQSFYSIPFERMAHSQNPLREPVLDMFTLTGRTFLSDLLLHDNYQKKVPPRVSTLEGYRFLENLVTNFGILPSVTSSLKMLS